MNFSSKLRHACIAQDYDGLEAVEFQTQVSVRKVFHEGKVGEVFWPGTSELISRLQQLKS
jgi:hypothetical protein